MGDLPGWRKAAPCAADAGSVRQDHVASQTARLSICRRPAQLHWAQEEARVDAGSRPESAEYEAAPSVARSSKSLGGFRRRAAQNLPQICAKVESPILWTLWK